MKEGRANHPPGRYLMLLSIHGLIRGSEMELGRDADTGGQVTYVVELARALAAHQDVERVDLVTRLVEDARIDDDYAREVEELCPGARIVRIPFGPRRYLAKESLWPHLDSMVDNLVRFLRSEGRAPDLVHGHYADAGYVASRLAALLNIPMAFTGHSLGRVKRERLLEKGTRPETIEKRYRITRRIEAEEQALDHAAFVVASTRQEVEEQYGLYDNHQLRRKLVIPPGVDLGRFSPPENRSKNDAAIHQEVFRFLSDPRKPIVLALSRADPRKNIPMLLRAFGRNDRLRERANLVLIAGNRDDLRKVSSPVRRVMTEVLYLIDRYDLYGSIAYPKAHANEEVPDLYRMAARTRGVFVNPALTEPFGLTLLEAAASGLPVVATRDGGPTDIIGTCRNGLLIDPLDPDAMGAAILDAIEDGARWRRWSRQGRRSALRSYSWETHVDKYMRGARAAIQRSEKRTLVFSVKRRLIPADRLLVSDIDNTLIGDREALEELIELLGAAGDRVAFAVATGRSLVLTREALRKWEIPTPTAMITSVGTAIRYGSHLVEDRGWERHIEFRWRPDALREAMKELPGLKLQPKWGQRPHKISYYYDPEKAPAPETIVRHLRRSKLRARVICSHSAYLDLLPIRASKGMALRYFAMRWGIPPERCLVAGDSGNDEEMLVGNTLSVVVGNYEQELERIRGLPRIYFAAGEYARGILEGLEHYDFLGNIRVPDLESPDDGP